MRLVLLLACLAVPCGCSTSSPDVSDAVAADPDEAVSAAETSRSPAATGAANRADPGAPPIAALGKDAVGVDSDALASLLRPYDSPLPSRGFLDGSLADPVGSLLTAADSSDPLVRSNAYRLLGLYPESGLAVSRLLDVAVDSAAVRTDRVGAMEGLAQPGLMDSAHVVRLLPLLAEADPMVQAAAVRLLGPWPSAKPALQRLADGADTHADVRRFARRALE